MKYIVTKYHYTIDDITFHCNKYTNPLCHTNHDFGILQYLVDTFKLTKHNLSDHIDVFNYIHHWNKNNVKYFYDKINMDHSDFELASSIYLTTFGKNIDFDLYNLLITNPIIMLVYI